MERRNRRIENGGAVRKKVREENWRGDKGAAGGRRTPQREKMEQRTEGKRKEL